MVASVMLSGRWINEWMDGWRKEGREEGRGLRDGSRETEGRREGGSERRITGSVVSAKSCWRGNGHTGDA